MRDGVATVLSESFAIPTCMELFTEIAKNVVDSLESDVPQEFAECRKSLLQVAQQIARGTIQQNHKPALRDLSHRLHRLMGTFRREDRILYVCRRIHTDCCIIQSLAESFLGSPENAIAALDHALIISGTPGHGRYMLVHELIHHFQAAIPVLLPRETPHTIEPNAVSTDQRRLSSTAHHIPRIPAPSILYFQTKLYNTPFIVSGYANDWPALVDHPWKHARYLSSVAGPGRMVPVEVGGHYLLDSWDQQVMSLDNFLSMLDFEDQPAQLPSDEKHYLAQHNLFIQFPDLRDDILVPDYAYATGFYKHLPDYKPPNNEEGIIFNHWLGPENTISPAHIDPYNNLYVQVVGRKTVWLAPPSVSQYMVPSSTEACLENTSHHDVFASEPDSSFQRHVVPEAMSAVLEPGDLLYFPSGWWHAMRSESTSFSLSIWF